MAERKQLKLDEVNWTKKEDVMDTFPSYIREQFALARAKNISRNVDISPFDLKAPFSSEYLIKDAHLNLETGKRHCLMGEAGTGKSTLFEALAGGTIKGFPLHLHVYHCQEIEMTEETANLSVLESVVRSHDFRNILLDCKREITKCKEASPAPSEADMAGLNESAEFVEMQLTKINAAGAEQRAAQMLRVLGFDEVGQTKPTSSLSGGLRMRVALCAAFFVQPDLLLLDEPTNHLDFPSVLWLENRLRGYGKSFLLVCHDRDLLNNVCTSVVVLEDKKIVYYNCGFAEFEKKRAAEDKKYALECDKFMARNRNVDFSSPAAREKAIKQKWMDNFQERQNLLAGKFTFPAAKPLPPQTDASGNAIPPSQISLINIEQVRFSYDVKAGLPFIFDTPIDFNVTCATRCGVMGPNGAGKSTLLKLLTGRLIPVEGKVSRHPTANVAYFAQHHVAELNLKQTAIEFMIEQFPEVSNSGLLRKHLGKVGITGSLAETRMTQLSGGQRSCVIFAKITYECPHLLIMDEPTNFLDLDSVDALIAATNKFEGALLLVSHNRQFLNKCAKQYLSVVPGQFNLYNDLKTCEKATYSFIEELESGTGGAKAGAGALAKGTSAGTNAAPSKTAEKKAEGFVIKGGGAAFGPLGMVPKKKVVAPEPVVAGRGGRGGARGGRGGAPPRGGARGGRGGK